MKNVVASCFLCATYACHGQYDPDIRDAGIYMILYEMLGSEVLK